MNPKERASHPSRTQIETLLEFLEKNPSLARGFSRVPCARDASIKMWENLSLELNSLVGCTKTWKQWTKYWTDKKSAVKKKGALRLRTRIETGSETDLMELTDIEERILSFMGGEGFAKGARHLEINPKQYKQGCLQNSTSEGDESPVLSNLAPPSTVQVEHSEFSLLEFIDVSDTDIPAIKVEQVEHHECGTLEFTDLADTNITAIKVEHLTPTEFSDPVDTNIPTIQVSQSPKAQEPPCTPPRLDAPVSLDMLTTPCASSRHPQRFQDVRKKFTGSPIPMHPNATTSNRRHRRQRPLSSQRQSCFATLADRFLRIEEQRTEMLQGFIDQQLVRDRSTSQALQAIGDGLKLLAEALQKSNKI